MITTPVLNLLSGLTGLTGENGETGLAGLGLLLLRALPSCSPCFPVGSTPATTKYSTSLSRMSIPVLHPFIYVISATQLTVTVRSE